MLDKVDFPLTNGQISEFILDQEYTSYFTLQQAISEMVEKTLVQEKTLTSEQDRSEIMESTISSYVDYWALDENGFLTTTDGEEEPAAENVLSDTDPGEQDETSFDDPDFSDMQD
jgi:hypothetical protein